MLGIAATRETVQVSAQVFEPAFGQIRRAQPVQIFERTRGN